MLYLVTTVYKKGKGTEWATGAIHTSKAKANSYAKGVKSSKKVKSCKVRGFSWA